MAKRSFPQHNFIDLTGDSSSNDELVAGPAPKSSRSVTRRSPIIPIVSPPRNVVAYTAEDTTPVAPANSRLRITANPDLYVVNNVDQAELPKNFRFINDYVFVGGTKRIDPEFLTGCDCRDNQGRNVGCEYVERCSCLEDTGRDKTGRKLGFPYGAEGTYKGCLQRKYLKTRYMVFECSKRCGCVSWCRNKVVQHGRKLPLEIFRTSNGRGWGLRSPNDIKMGQFIDTYRGEVLTEDETDRRERQGANSKDSYLFSLDKFEDQEEMYVVDGEFMGGPTRFINHSCDPNCAIFSVSTSGGDAKVYDLAFFAQEDIPAGTELTFDYLSNEEDPTSTTDADKVKGIEEKKGKLATRCLCGSDICRGYLWM